MELQLADTVEECYRICDRMKADGASLEDRTLVLEKALRLAWPFTREWHYLCANCDDLGLEIRSCDGSPLCGRHKLHLAHSYGKPCYCAAGRKFEQRQKSPEDLVSAAAKVSKPSRFGR